MPQDHAASADGIRLILCLKFDPHASFEDLAALKKALLDSPEAVHCMEVSGSFDFMLEAAVPDLAAYQALVDSLTARFGFLLERYEANFVCRQYDRQDDSEQHCLWVPCSDGRQRVDCARIDKVEADGDYVRITSGANGWLLHATLTSIARQLQDSDFIQLSRSVVVRTGFISRLVHHGRRWAARLADGSEYRIAKGRSAGILAMLRADSPRHIPVSSIPAPPPEMPLTVTEKTMH